MAGTALHPGSHDPGRLAFSAERVLACFIRFDQRVSSRQTQARSDENRTGLFVFVASPLRVWLNAALLVVVVAKEEGQDVDSFLLDGLELIGIDAERLQDRWRDLLV